MNIPSVFLALVVNPCAATKIKINQNESAAETYTGTSASDINSVTLSFFHSSHQASFQKKNISPYTGENIA